MENVPTNEINNGWTVVTKKTKERAKKDNKKVDNKKETKKEQRHKRSHERRAANLQTVYAEGLRPIRKSDFTLTRWEETKIKKEGGGIWCPCCQHVQIEHIIKRPFGACHACYCCAGDNPAFEREDLCVFVSDDLRMTRIFWDYECPYKYPHSK